MADKAKQSRITVEERPGEVQESAPPIEVVRYSPDDQVSMAEMLGILIKHRYVILALMFGTAIFGVGHLLLTFSPTYTAEASFMPQGGGQAGGSGLEAVASRFGIDFGSGGGRSSPAFYASLLDSREIMAPLVTDTFLVEGFEDGERVQFRGTLVDLLDLQDLREPLARERSVEWLRAVTSQSVTPSTGVVEFSVTTRWPALSEAIAHRLLDRVNRFNLESLQSQAAAEREFVQERLAEAGEELRAAENELKRFLETNRDFQNSPELSFQYERLQRQVNMRQQLFTGLSQSYEQARLTEVRNIPVITVLEPPVEPVERNPRGLKRRAVIGLALGLALGMFYAFGREFVARDAADTPEYRELKWVTKETVDDVRRVFRRIRGVFTRSRD